MVLKRFQKLCVILHSIQNWCRLYSQWIIRFEKCCLFLFFNHITKLKGFYSQEYY